MINVRHVWHRGNMAALSVSSVLCAYEYERNHHCQSEWESASTISIHINSTLCVRLGDLWAGVVLQSLRIWRLRYNLSFFGWRRWFRIFFLFAAHSRPCDLHSQTWKQYRKWDAAGIESVSSYSDYAKGVWCIHIYMVLETSTIKMLLRHLANTGTVWIREPKTTPTQNASLPYSQLDISA